MDSDAPGYMMMAFPMVGLSLFITSIGLIYNALRVYRNRQRPDLTVLKDGDA